MKKFDGIIFDIDGTLTSTNDLIFATFNYVAEKYLKRSYSPKEITALFGPTEEVILEEMMHDDFKEAMTDYYKFYEMNHSKFNAYAYNGIIDLIGKLKKDGHILSIYTGKGRKSSEITLNNIGAFDYFDMIVTGDDIEGHKPSPDGILKFVDKFNLDKSRVLMIGDAPSDIKAARTAGVKMASVLWDCYAKEKVLSMESDYYFNTVDELKSFLSNSHIK